MVYLHIFLCILESVSVLLYPVRESFTDLLWELQGTQCLLQSINFTISASIKCCVYMRGFFLSSGNSFKKLILKRCVDAGRPAEVSQNVS